MSTIWTNRRPGEVCTPSNDPEIPAVVVATFYDSDWIRIPDDTPDPANPERRHPQAGQQVRATRRFRSIDPARKHGGEHHAHLWAEGAGLGVAETPGGFVVYEIASWPSGLPVHDDRWG